VTPVRPDRQADKFALLGRGEAAEDGWTMSSPPRILFCSYHCYFDPSSGAAISVRDLLELLVSRGWPCAVFCGPQQDFEESEPLDQMLKVHGLSPEIRRVNAGRAGCTLYHFVQGGVPVTIYSPSPTTPRRPPSAADGETFLGLFAQAVERFRPDLVFTYGGHWLARRLMATAKGRGLPVVFGLYNLEYRDPAVFQDVDAGLVQSHFAQQHYRQTLGLTATAIPGPWNWDRVVCPHVDPRFVTFVNPQIQKGVEYFARIAEQLFRRRPDIPLLVVEGRGKASALGRSGVDLAPLTNLFRMANTPDPRSFFEVSRVVLMPSLWQEAFGRVAAESLMNGIPVLASDRGALPEVLADAGDLFPIPSHYTATVRLTPAADEVSVWVEAVIRLFDDPAYYAAQRRRCLAAAEVWRPERLAARFEAFFRGVAGRVHPSS